MSKVLSSAGVDASSEPEFLAKQHIMFAFRSLKFLPTPYQPDDSNRVSLAYFCLSSLGLLRGSAVSSAATPDDSAIPIMLKDKQRLGYCDWLYRQQKPNGGFRGSDSMEGAWVEPPLGGGRGAPPPGPSIDLTPEQQREYDFLMSYPDSDGEAQDDDLPIHAENPLDPANIIQSYTALLILGLLSDDFTRLDRRALLNFVGKCQDIDGSFKQFPGCEESPDTRSTYSAFVICSILDDWTSIDLKAAVNFVVRCYTLEGGYSTRPGLEPHGGSTYTALASLSLASSLSQAPDPEATLRWLVLRQTPPVPTPEDDGDEEEDSESEETENQIVEKARAGFQGRAGKAPDACYSFWCAAALAILRPTEMLYDAGLDSAWLHSCQHKMYGGIARDPGSPPDVYHTYLSLAALSIGGHPDLLELDPEWNVSRQVKQRIQASIAALRLQDSNK